MNSSTVVSCSGAPKISLVRASSKKTRRSGSRYHDPSWAALSACCRRTAGLADRSGLSMKTEIIRFAPSCDGVLSRAARHYLHTAWCHPCLATPFVPRTFRDGGTRIVVCSFHANGRCYWTPLDFHLDTADFISRCCPNGCSAPTVPKALEKQTIG